MKQLFLAFAAAALVGGGPAYAHHSFAMFDNQKVDLIRGTLLKFTYLNPHSWISIEGQVNNQGPMQRWDIEATSPGSLAQIGIRPDVLKTGDKLTVALHPLRDGRQGGSLVFVVTPDGVSHGANPSILGFDLATLKPQ